MVQRALLAVLLVTAGISLANAETPVETEPLSVPAGTMLHCRTTQTLTTRLNARGDAFTISVAEPVSINGNVAVPAGATLAGRITFMERPGRIKGVGEMRLTVEHLTLPDGRSFPLSATLMTAYGPGRMKVVGSEGLIKGPTSHAPDVEEIGAGTAGGALLGLIFDHPVIGATVGFTATTVDRLRRRGKDLTIPVGTQLNYQLTHALDIGNNAAQTTAENQVRSAGE
jgi:hypothetical protein